MKRALHFFLFSIVFFNLLKAQQIDQCLSGSGNDFIGSTIKYLPDSSKLYIVHTDSRDGIYANDSATLYLIKADKFDHIQFVHPLYYKSDDTTGNSTEPLFRFAAIYTNNNEIFVAFTAEYLYDPTFYYRYRLNYEILDYNGGIIKKANNAAIILDYDYSIESRYSLDQIHIISPGEGNYSIMIKISFNSHGDVTETFPFFRITNNNLDAQSIFAFDNNRSPFSRRYILPVKNYFVIPFIRTDIYDTGGDAFPSISIINANGVMVYDTILSYAPHTQTTDFSNKDDRLFFTTYSLYSTGLMDSLNNLIYDSIIAKSYILNYGAGFQLTQVRYKRLPAFDPGKFLFVDPANISFNLGLYAGFPDIRNSWLLNLDQLNDSTYRFGLTNLDNNSLPEIYSFVSQIHAFDNYSISYNTVVLPDSGLVLIYLVKEEGAVHFLKFNSTHQLISQKVLPVSVSGYDNIYFNYFPINKKLIALTTGSSQTKLYMLDYADTVSSYKDTLLLSVDTDNTFEYFEDGTGNIFVYTQTNQTEPNACFDQTYDVIIYKISGSLPTNIRADKNLLKISCYPNPSSDYFDIDVSKLPFQTYFIGIYSTDGKLASYNAFQNTGVCRLDAHSIPAGTYELVIASDKEIIGNTKIVIAR
ncbi:MAG: hypothetical protein JWN78_1595 [Bacteroidota bacterium]|nr:hypothetical protein [Bacteroidota bacterium]